MSARVATSVAIKNGDFVTMEQRETVNHSSVWSKSNLIEFKTSDGKTETVIFNHSLAYRFVKRFFDIVLSLLALVVLSPIFLITAIAIKKEDGNPVIFKQDRMSSGGL